MSNTRHAPSTSEQRDERFASDPLLCKGIKAGDVIRRCETLNAPAQIEAALFLQYVSNLPGSLDKFAADLLAAFPERIGTASMLRFGLKLTDNFSAAQVRAVRGEVRGMREASEISDDNFPLHGEIQHGLFEGLLQDDGSRDEQRRQESLTFPATYPASVFVDICRANFLSEAPALLRQFCLDPAMPLEELRLGSFHDLPGALIAYMDQWEARALGSLVVTGVGAKVLEALNYSEDQKCLALVEGFARTGKTFITKAWCAARPGRRRYLSLSEASTEKDFFREISKALGATSSYARKGNELRERVNDILQPGFLTLIIDEAHHLWPTRNIRNASPRRIEWVRCSLANYDVPVVMIATHQFTRAQQQIEKHTNWSSEQLIGRIAFCAKLPDHLEKGDIAAVARFHLPEAEERTIGFLVDYVIASKKHLASIEHGVKAARHEARKAGRAVVTHRDVMIGFNNTLLPSDRNLASSAHDARVTKTPQERRQNKVYAAPGHGPFKTISAPVPGRDSGTALIVTTDRKNMRSGQASLSTT